MPAQRLAKQRKSLKRQLGLDQAGMDQLVDTDDLIKEEDLVTSGSVKSPAQAGQKDAASLISDMTGKPVPRVFRVLRLHAIYKPTWNVLWQICSYIRLSCADNHVLLSGGMACRAERP